MTAPPSGGAESPPDEERADRANGGDTCADQIGIPVRADETVGRGA